MGKIEVWVVIQVSSWGGQRLRKGKALFYFLDYLVAPVMLTGLFCLCEGKLGPEVPETTL